MSRDDRRGGRSRETRFAGAALTPEGLAVHALWTQKAEGGLLVVEWRCFELATGAERFRRSLVRREDAPRGPPAPLNSSRV